MSAIIRGVVSTTHANRVNSNGVFIDPMSRVVQVHANRGGARTI